MIKDIRVYLDDIIESSEKIASYIAGKDKSEFENNTELQDAIIRRLSIIGEAIKRIPQDFQNRHHQIE